MTDATPRPSFDGPGNASFGAAPYGAGPDAPPAATAPTVTAPGMPTAPPLYPPVLRPRPPSSRGRRIVAVIAVLGVVLVGSVAAAFAAVLVVTHRQPTPATSAADRFDQDLAATLATRTTALRHKNEKAFLAAVDPTKAALVAHERLAFRNLVQLPLVEPTYRLTDDVGTTPSDAVPGARVALVSLEHRVGQADVQPVALSYQETWERRGTALVLVAAAPKEGPEGALTSNPLDLVPLRILTGGLVTVAAPTTCPAAQEAAIDALAEKEAATVRRMWGTRPGPTAFMVFLGSSQQIGTWFGRKPGTDYAGFTEQLRASRNLQVYGGARVLIDLDKAATTVAGKTQLPTTLRHEFTHAQTIGVKIAPTRAANDAPYPVWAEEGFAAWIEELDTPLPRSNRLDGLRALSRQGYDATGFPPSQSSAFYASNVKLTEIHYADASMVFRYVATVYGPDQAIALYLRIASGQPGSTQAVLGVSRQAFESAWATWLSRQLRGRAA